MRLFIVHGSHMNKVLCGLAIIVVVWKNMGDIEMCLENFPCYSFICLLFLLGLHHFSWLLNNYIKDY